MTFELINYLAHDDQTKAHTILIEGLVLLLNEAKDLKQLTLILIFDANPGVLDLNFDLIMAVDDSNLNSSFGSELHSVGLQAKDYLSQSLIVRTYRVIGEAMVGCLKEYFSFDGLHPLEAHDHLHALSNVKGRDVGPELASLDLGVV